MRSFLPTTPGEMGASMILTWLLLLGPAVLKAKTGKTLRLVPGHSKKNLKECLESSLLIPRAEIRFRLVLVWAKDKRENWMKEQSFVLLK